MPTMQKFVIGGFGGLLPLIIGILSFNVTSLIDHWDLLNPAYLLGYSIKAVILFTLGGGFASLSDGVTKPLAALQIGIAAPAIITTYINGAAVLGPEAKPSTAATSATELGSSAYAAEISSEIAVIKVDFLGDVIQGITKPLPAIQRERQQQLKKPQHSQAPSQQSPQTPSQQPKTRP
jgi:hypothetical protein